MHCGDVAPITANVLFACLAMLCCLHDVLDMVMQSIPVELLSQAPALALRIIISRIRCRFGFAVRDAM